MRRMEGWTETEGDAEGGGRQLRGKRNVREDKTDDGKKDAIKD